jgi:hypothetical protein
MKMLEFKGRSDIPLTTFVRTLREVRRVDSATLVRKGAAVMIRTVEAIIDEKGQVSLLEPVRPSSARRALVTILEGEPVAGTALLSEMTLSEDWDWPEEDAAWAHLQPR